MQFVAASADGPGQPVVGGDIVNSACKACVLCRSCTGRIIQRIPDLPVISDRHDAIPILRPMQDDLPFAMSLDVCQDVASFDPSGDVLEHPMCELLYFLDGSGSVTVRSGRGDQAALGVRAGDSVLTSGQSVVVYNKSAADSGSSGMAVTFLRMILPLQYVVTNARSARITEECRSAASKVPCPIVFAHGCPCKTSVNTSHSS